MSMKKEIARQIQIIEAEIKELEIKRSRSQAALIEALISRRTPEESEMRFFRQYTADIEVKRDQLAILNKRLESLV